jgi:hypothetical protein
MSNAVSLLAKDSATISVELGKVLCGKAERLMRTIKEEVRWPSATDQLLDPRMALPNQPVQKSLPSRLDQAGATQLSSDSRTRSSRDTIVG